LPSQADDNSLYLLRKTGALAGAFVGSQLARIDLPSVLTQRRSGWASHWPRLEPSYELVLMDLLSVLTRRLRGWAARLARAWPTLGPVSHGGTPGIRV